MNVAQISTGFIEIPGRVSLNIYVQGCEKRCPGCQNPELQSFDGSKGILSVNDIDSLLTMYPLCDSVCWLGGDAVYQPVAFKELNKEFTKRGLVVCLYTGKLFDEIQDLIDDVDIIIDGEWNGIPVTKSDSRYMGEPGTTNQRILIRRLDNSMWEQLDWCTFNCVASYHKKINELKRKVGYLDAPTAVI